MAVTQRLRFEILKRDNYTCRYCGASRDDDAKLTVDHVTPVALGGTDDPTNLVAACKQCNAGKSSVPPDAELVAQVADDAFRFARALQMVTAQRRAAVAEMAANVAWFNERWSRWTYNSTGEIVDRDGTWGASVERFFASGLDRTDLDRLIDVAMNFKARDTWRFFCGKAWQEIRERQEAARQVMAATAAGVSVDAGDSPDYERGYSEGFDDGASYAESKTAAAVAQAREEAEQGYERGFRDGVARARQTPDGADPRPPWGE